MDRKEDSAHIVVQYRAYAIVWIILLALTWLTVTISGVRIGGVTIFFPLLIASVKATMVLSFFMHLKYEKGLFKLIILIMLVIFLVLICLVFSDVGYR